MTELNTASDPAGEVTRHLQDLEARGSRGLVAQHEVKHYQARLEEMCEERTASLRKALEQMAEAQRIALHHHERWDGAGYPNGLAGSDIPLWGRICAVADVFDAVTSERPYKPAYPNEEALRVLRDGRGKHFDPRVVDVFFECLEDILAIQDTFKDD